MGSVTGNDLPRGWHVAELGEICQEDRMTITKSDPGYPTMPYLGLEHIEPTTGRILIDERDARDSDSKSNNFRFTSEHVLYGKLRPYLNKVALPDFSGRCTTEILPLRPVSVERRWLAYLLRRPEVVDHAMRGKTGSRMPRTSMPALLALSVVVPPRQEQQQVVKRLDHQLAAADRIRRHTRAQLSQIEAMERSLLGRAFPASPGQQPPMGWCWAKLGDVCEIHKGRTAKREWYSKEGAWLVRYRDLTTGSGVSWSAGRNTFVDVAHEAKLQRLTPPIVLVGADAHDPATIGRKVVIVKAVPRRVSRAYFAGEMLGIRRRSNAVELDIVCHWLRSPAGYRQIQENVSGGHLNVNPARGILVPIPPQDGQRRFIADLTTQLAGVERARKAVQSQLEATNALFDATLRQAFEP